jgi:hypothetical protein
MKAKHTLTDCGTVIHADIQRQGEFFVAVIKCADGSEVAGKSTNEIYALSNATEQWVKAGRPELAK